MSDDQLSLRVLSIHLSSWRYLLLSTVPPLADALYSISAPFTVIILLVVGYLYYLCWRLRLDEQLFILLADGAQAATFDDAMQRFWGRKSTVGRTMDSRWRGARRLLMQALFATALLWAVFILMIALR